MQLAKVRLKSGEQRLAVVGGEYVHCVDVAHDRVKSLGDILHAPDAAELTKELLADDKERFPLADVQFLAPIDQHEVWAAGVTYKRSQEERKRESEGAAQFYDLVYTAERPELFFKATPYRVVGHGGTIHVRKDSKWSVPEPELALVVSPDLRLVGYTIGDDVSSRDIEGENPLYLPQAKFYDASCALGPCITLASDMPPLDQVSITMIIERDGKPIFEGSTSVSRMKRTPEDLIGWLSHETSFPTGVVLMTGTGIIPPDDFDLTPGDQVHIDVTGIGRLSNVVAHRS